jgi:hypothetical protein
VRDLPTVGIVGDENAAQALLYDQLSTGYTIVIDVTTDIGNPKGNGLDSHFVLVVGMDIEKGKESVTIYDPFGYAGEANPRQPGIRTIQWGSLWASWHANMDDHGAGNG